MYYIFPLFMKYLSKFSTYCSYRNEIGVQTSHLTVSACDMKNSIYTYLYLESYCFIIHNDWALVLQS
jgi:hypothetical protein